MKIGLIFPNQLFENHPVMAETKEQYVVQEALIIGGDSEWPLQPHAKKLLLQKASIRAYADLQDLSIIDTFTELKVDDCLEVVVCRLFDDILERRLRAFCDEHEISFRELETPGFVTPSDWGREFFNQGKKPFMKTFYEAQRKRMGILIESNGEPTGGRWSYDDENRKKFPVRSTPPEEPSYSHTDEEKKWLKVSRAEITKSGVDTFGEDDGFRYPITHAGARKWLDQFLRERYTHFGTYEDALSYRSTFLYHSVLTPMLNNGLLTPAHVTERALELGAELEVEINNVEGFIRQIIGWREFMSIMYLKHGRYLRTQNFWNFTASMPQSVYDGNTGIDPVDDVLKKVRKEGYAHHIERLMVLGNFFMRMRIKPDDVFQWFSEMFIDAYDWVMVPNVYGMSQFSDGGMMVTKPYISGSNYIRKMSDYKNGAWCEIWDALFWTFIDDHHEYFSKQYRMKMMVSHLTKMGGEKLAKHHEIAAEFREQA